MPDTIYTCWPVITEACYLLRRRLDLFERLLEAVHDGVYELLPLTELDVPEIGGTMTKYQDQGIDLADACLVRLANREGTLTVITVDERHFQLFRTAAGDPFQLLPRVSGA
jgi:predicted nucleic acid-binding protein